MPSLVDVFVPVVGREELHPNFTILRESRGHAPARAAIRGVFEELPDPDHHFVREFQGAAFDARLWELYVFAAGRCAGFRVSRPFDRPDYLFSDGLLSVWVEATTANPSPIRPVSRDIRTRDVVKETHHDVPISLAGALTSKLKKRYWELPHVANTPLVVALADFHSPDVHRDSSGPLQEYLYGERDASVFDSEGRLQLSVRPVVDHRLGAKIVPSGFFALPNAEHISAVMFSNAGTIAKFSRIGFERAPTLYPDIWMQRWGVSYSFDPNEAIGDPFVQDVGAQGKPAEHWCEGLTVFHNPRARLPVPDHFFRRYGQHWRVVGDRTLLHDFHPLWSITDIRVGPTTDAVKAHLRRERRERLDFMHAYASKAYALRHHHKD
jgi:hypothetical protein